MTVDTTVNGSNANGVHKKAFTPHPLAPLSAEEIVHGCDLVRTQWPDKTELHFKSVM